MAAPADHGAGGLLPALTELSIIGLLAVAVLVVFRKLRLPPIVGFLATGALVGPGGLSLVSSVERVEHLAEVGVALLLFTIGLELSPERLGSFRRELTVGGTLQVVATTLIASLVAAIWLPRSAAIVVGAVFALSSTALVLRHLKEKDELLAPHGRISLGVLLFQDLAVVPMMLLVPMLAAVDVAQVGRIALGLVLLAVLFVVARRVVPRLLDQVARTDNREIFLLGVVGLCLGMAALVAHLGASLTIGAFLAGIVIADSRYGHQALAEVLPLRDSLAFLFFVSVGMLLDPVVVFEQPGLLFGITASVIAGKIVLVTGIGLLLGHTVRSSVIAAFALGPVGEFSFILAYVAREAGLVAPDVERLLVSIVVLSMMIAPLLMGLAPKLASRLPTRPGQSSEPERRDELHHHVLIAGYGSVARSFVAVLASGGIPRLALVTSPDRYDAAVQDGTPVELGDSTQESILVEAGIKNARSLVVALDDPDATRRTVSLARQLAPDLHIVVRSRQVAEIGELRQLGADEVVPDELEASIEIFVRVMRHLRIPENLIRIEVALLREGNYGALREPGSLSVQDLAGFLGKSAVETFVILEGSPAVGKSLADLRLRSESGAQVVAVVREGREETNPDPNLPFEPRDVLLLTGSHEALDRAGRALAPPPVVE